LQDELEIVYDPGERKDKGVQTSPALSRRASSGDIRLLRENHKTDKLSF